MRKPYGKDNQKQTNSFIFSLWSSNQSVRKEYRITHLKAIKKTNKITYKSKKQLKIGTIAEESWHFKVKDTEQEISLSKHYFMTAGMQKVSAIQWSHHFRTTPPKIIRNNFYLF